jgi:hypothetical protein
MGILAIITMILPVLSSVLSGYKIIPTNLSSLISSLSALLPGLLAVFQTKGTTETIPEAIVALLTAISTQITALKADSTLNPVVLSDIAALDDVITKTLAADAAAQKTVDPTVLTDIPSV